MARKFEDIINVTPEFLKEFSGERIQFGPDIFNIAETGVTSFKAPKTVTRETAGQQATQTLDPNLRSGLISRGREGASIAESFRHFQPNIPEIAQLRTQAPGVESTFVPRTPFQQQLASRRAAGEAPADILRTITPSGTVRATQTPGAVAGSFFEKKLPQLTPTPGQAAQQAQQFGNARLANRNFINAAFQELHGRDASPQELSNFDQKGLQDVFNAVKAGAPQPEEIQPPEIQDITDEADFVIDTAGSAPPSIEDSTPVYESLYSTIAQDLENKRNALEAVQQKQLDNVRIEKEATEKKIEDFNQKQQDILETDVQPLTTPFQKDLEESERKRLKIEENFFENQKLSEELGTLLTEGSALITQMKGVTGLAAIRNPRINKAISDVTARAGVIEAVMASKNNQITVAENLINRSVNAINADRQSQLNYYNALLSFYGGLKDDEGNKLITITKDEKGYIDDQIGLLETDLANSQATANNIKDAMTDPTTAAIYGQAGITLNDTPEMINQKLTDYTYQQEKSDIDNELAEDGFEYIPLPEQLIGKDSEGITTRTDSRGNERIYWKKPEVEDLDTQVVTVGGRKKLINVQTGETIRDLGVSSEGGGGITPQTLAKNFFTKTQLSKGATAAGMTITEFGNLTADEANEFITGVDEISDFDSARQFITDNPDASFEEMEIALRENTKLNDGDIVKVLNDAGKFSKTATKKIEKEEEEESRELEIERLSNFRIEDMLVTMGRTRKEFAKTFQSAETEEENIENEFIGWLLNQGFSKEEIKQILL